MGIAEPFDIFLTAPPGLESFLREEVTALGFTSPKAEAGGVTIRGGWPEVWRANLMVRGATRVLVRIASFHAVHLAQLDKRARQLPWTDLIPSGAAVRIEVTCRKSKIYHSGAAAQRIAGALRQGVSAEISNDADLRVLVRIEKDLCTVSLDTSGELLHRRGFKRAVRKAPLRETLAALFLRACDYDGQESVLDPMCGSGTFVIEAAEIAARLAPGRERSFAFQRLKSFDAGVWAKIRNAAIAESTSPATFCYGYDRDKGAIEASLGNAERSGVSDRTVFLTKSINALMAPEGLPGLVMVNPPYGARIGDKRVLKTLYQTLGRRLKEQFSGWRVGLVTSEKGLAMATGLPFLKPGPPVPHGPLRIKLYRTGILP